MNVPMLRLCSAHLRSHFHFESSKSGDDELIIKPPQSSSELDSVLHHKDEKKQRHSKEYKSNKRHHHHHHHHHHNHKSRHLKSSSATSSTRNRNMESKSFHYRDNKGKDQNRESERGLTDQDIVDARSKRLIKDVIESDSGRNVKYDEITDVRDVRLVKDIRESKRYKNEEKNTHYFEEMKVEWRKKRLQWLQHQKNEDGTLLVEKEDLQGKKCEKELNENYKNIDLEYSRSEKNIRDHLQIDGEIYYSLISPVSSEEESMNYEETEKSQELIDEEIEHVSNEEDSTKLSDVSSGDNDGESTSEEESVETISSSENEKDVSQKESLTTEPDKETKETAYKKEDQNSKPIEANAIPEEKDLFLEQPDVHTPKRPVYCPAIQGCRSIDGFHVLNRIEEGTYGVVYRARDKETKEIVALKRLKMEREKEGFPITSLREINTLLKAQHPNIVTVREIVVGSNMDRIYIVMDYVEHDIKSLMKTMPRPFLIGEVKTLLMQLLCAVAHLHDNWILHRDLKTSNLLLSHDGILKVGDFGLAREYGSPLKSYTSVVVTLWYRAPELLLGAKKYSTPIDMWSVGCIFAELLTKSALFPGKSESDQINRIFKDLGTPSEKIWPGYSELPLVKSINITQYPYNNLKSRFSPTFTDLGFDLLNRFLTYNPARRISAEKAKSHAFFDEKPKPVPPNMFPTWPAKSEQEYRTARSSPKPPLGGIHYSRQ